MGSRGEPEAEGTAGSQYRWVPAWASWVRREHALLPLTGSVGIRGGEGSVGCGWE